MKIFAALRRFWSEAFAEEKAVFVIGMPLLFFFGGFEYSKLHQTASPPLFHESKSATQSRKLRVHVVGAVKKPALLTLPDGLRVIDAVRQANATSIADLNALNLSAPLRDGQKIVVPSRGAKPQTSQSQTSHRVLDASSRFSSSTIESTLKSPTQIININTASASELESLPGVGPAIAARIVTERSQKPFTSFQDVDRVKGIGTKKLEQIAPYITF